MTDLSRSARRLIAAFPATGKTYFASRNDNVADSDSSAFSWASKGVRHPDWPHNYLRHIKAELLDGRTVLVSTHSEVRGLLEDEEWAKAQCRVLRRWRPGQVLVFDFVAGEIYVAYGWMRRSDA